MMIMIQYFFLPHRFKVIVGLTYNLEMLYQSLLSVLL